MGSTQEKCKGDRNLGDDSWLNPDGSALYQRLPFCNYYCSIQKEADKRIEAEKAGVAGVNTNTAQGRLQQ